MKNLIILGFGGNCIDIIDTINEINEKNGKIIYECIGFLDDNQECWGKTHYGVKILGSLNTASNYNNCFFINGIGSSSNFWKKKDIISKTQIPLEKFTTIIHPSASVSKLAKLGYGTTILQNVTISSNVTIGNHVIILPNSVISHDSVIGDYTCITSGVCISGGVKIGSSSYLGTNSAIINNAIIEDYCLIGMGSIVINNVKANSVVIGNPAKFHRNTIKG